MYYLRTRAAADAIKFTVDQQALAKRKADRAAKAGSPAAPSTNAHALKVRRWKARLCRWCPRVFECATLSVLVAQETNKGAALPGGAKSALLDEDLERERQLAAMVCSLENKDACLMCGS